MARNQILVHRWGPRSRISAMFRRRTQPEFSFVCGASLQCRRILGGQNLVRVRIVVAPILRAGARAKGGKGGRGAKERKNVRRFLFSLPAPFDSPHFLLSSGSFNMALSRAKLLARPKKTPALQATVVKANHFQAFSNWHFPNVSQMVRNHFRCKVARFSLLHFFPQMVLYLASFVATIPHVFEGMLKIRIG